MPLPPRYAEGTENSFLETAFRKTSFMEHYPILQKQLLFGSSSCFGSLEQNVFVLLNDKSRMKGDFHVRFREKFEVKVLLLNYTQTRQGFTIPFLIVFRFFDLREQQEDSPVLYYVLPSSSMPVFRCFLSFRDRWCDSCHVHLRDLCTGGRIDR